MLEDGCNRDQKPVGDVRRRRRRRRKRRRRKGRKRRRRRRRRRGTYSNINGALINKALQYNYNIALKKY